MPDVHNSARLTLSFRPTGTLLLLGLAGGLSACAGPPPQATLANAAPAMVQPAPPAPAAAPAPAPTFAAATGTASWYRTGRWLHNTSSGQRLDNNALTAASYVLTMGTMVRVGLIDDSRFVVVRVNDRMPNDHRLIDLSELAAKQLGLMDRGIATVTVTPILVASAP